MTAYAVLVPGRTKASSRCSTGALRAPRSTCVQKALKVIRVEDGRGGRTVAVGVWIARGELIQEALEVVGVQDRGRSRVIAVGVAEGETSRSCPSVGSALGRRSERATHLEFAVEGRQGAAGRARRQPAIHRVPVDIIPSRD